MIEHELLFLGVLSSGPRHGYDIKRLIEKEMLPHIGVKIKSIYYPLRKLETLGFVAKNAGKEGRRPEKFTYSITAKGQDRFSKLKADSFLSVDRPYFGINMALYFLSMAPKQEVKRRLQGRVTLLERVRRNLNAALEKTVKSPNPIERIFRHDLAMIEAEILWSKELAKSL